jgi:hypothetical protein
MSDQPDIHADELAEAIAAIEADPPLPEAYLSHERGVVPIDGMDELWRHRAAKAIEDGRRPDDAAIPRMVEALRSKST